MKNEDSVRANIRRKSLLFIPLAWLLFALPSYSQIIENPAVPLSKNSGRVLKLEEVWRITDESGDFFLKYPHDLRISGDGSLYVADNEELLKFSSEGRFLKNFYKKGSGPGEIQRQFYYHLSGEDVFIQDLNSRRLWRTDKSGVFKEPIDLASKDLRGFLGISAAGFVFLRSVWPTSEKGTGRLAEILESPVLVSRDGKKEQTLWTFRTRVFVAPQSGRAWDFSALLPDAEGLNLYAFHGRDYLIEVLSLSKKQIVRRFRRRFPKVLYVEEDWEKDFRKEHGAPRLEFESDILGLFVNGPHLWVETAVGDKVKGRLFDVFDPEGRYVDCLHLGAGKSLQAVRGEFLFSVEKNPDESFRIVKYKIEG